MNMSNDRLHSFFDCVDKIHPSKKIWEQFKVSQYQNDAIEYKQECWRISEGKRTLKPISIFIGEQTLYYIKNNTPAGMLSLLLTTITTKQYEGQLILRLNRNQQHVDLKVANPEEFFKLLKKKCLQATFHEDFIIEKKIGKGNFANVYLATRKETGDQFAVKVFNKQQVLGQTKGKESLENEIRIMRKLNQQSIIHLHEVHETQNSIYLVMDLLEGGELFERMKKTIYSKTSLQQLMYNILKAINYMHQKKCMHRDLKPQNILLRKKDDDVDIVIADLGLATFVNEIPLFKRCGTPGFVAPEILKYDIGFDYYNEKCDIFSAGAIFYMLTTGVSPFKGEDIIATIQKNKDCVIDFSFKQILKAPKSLQSLIKKMLRASPKSRYSAEDCLQHRYFKEIFKPEDILDSKPDQYQNILPQGNFDAGKGSFELITKEQQWNGNADTIGSLSNNSIKEQKNPYDKQSNNLSKFSQFCQQMEQFQKGATPRKKNQESLHKFAIKNSYHQKICKDDNDVVEENDNESKIIINKPSINGRLFKKSNSLDV